MAFFNFGIFGEQEHRVFNYKPRYYDPEEEEMKKKFADVDGTMEKKTYVPGSYIQGAFNRENRYRTKGSLTRKIIGLVGLLLIIVAIIYMAKIYPTLRNGIEQEQALKQAEIALRSSEAENAHEDSNAPEPQKSTPSTSDAKDQQFDSQTEDVYVRLMIKWGKYLEKTY